MIRLSLVSIVVALVATGVASAHSEPSPDLMPARERADWIEGRLAHHRYVCENGSPRFRSTRWHCRATEWTARELRDARAAIPLTPGQTICAVFGRYCAQAIQVARCESGIRTWAENGQYLGIFQMGSSERRIYGHGSTVLEQARAAWRYFVRSGRDWSPWSCKPWG